MRQPAMKQTALFNCWFIIILILVSFSRIPPAYAEKVRNGNELALSYATNNAAGKIALIKSVAGVFHTFRYLKVTEIKANAPRDGVVTLTAVEPSSDIMVRIIVNTPLSLEIVKSLQTGECMACKGRINSSGTVQTNLLVIDPAIINHKDREAPKPSKELNNLSKFWFAPLIYISSETIGSFNRATVFSESFIFSTTSRPAFLNSRLYL